VEEGTGVFSVKRGGEKENGGNIIRGKGRGEVTVLGGKRGGGGERPKSRQGLSAQATSGIVCLYIGKKKEKGGGFVCLGGGGKGREKGEPPYERERKTNVPKGNVKSAGSKGGRGSAHHRSLCGGKKEGRLNVFPSGKEKSCGRGRKWNELPSRKKKRKKRILALRKEILANETARGEGKAGGDRTERFCPSSLKRGAHELFSISGEEGGFFDL